MKRYGFKLKAAAKFG